MRLSWQAQRQSAKLGSEEQFTAYLFAHKIRSQLPTSTHRSGHRLGHRLSPHPRSPPAVPPTRSSHAAQCFIATRALECLPVSAERAAHISSFRNRRSQTLDRLSQNSLGIPSLFLRRRKCLKIDSMVVVAKAAAAETKNCAWACAQANLQGAGPAGANTAPQAHTQMRSYTTYRGPSQCGSCDILTWC